MTFEINGIKLVGSFKQGDRRKPRVLIIHGGGLQSDQAGRFLEWQNILSEQGFGSLVFNHSGIPPSEGSVQKNTLELRLSEACGALAFFQALNKTQLSQIIIVGVSMGGHIATQLAAKVQSYGLILCEPGSFVESAEDKLFGPSFTHELRQERNWETVSTRSFNRIADYKGNLLIVVPENDTVVPPAVSARYFREARSAQTKELYILKDATHFYFRPNDPAINPLWRKVFYQKTIDWLQNFNLVQTGN